MPEDITVRIPETGDVLHFPIGTPVETIQAQATKFKMAKMGGQSKEQQQIANLPNIQQQLRDLLPNVGSVGRIPSPATERAAVESESARRQRLYTPPQPQVQQTPPPNTIIRGFGREVKNIGSSLFSEPTSTLPGWEWAQGVAQNPINAVPVIGPIITARAQQIESGQGLSAIGATAADILAVAAPYIALKMPGFVTKRIASSLRVAPEKVAELAALPAKEEAIRQRVVAASRQVRAQASSMYPEVATPVDMTAPRQAAQQAKQQLVAHNVPSQVSRIGAIPSVPKIGAETIGSNPPPVTMDVAEILQQIDAANPTGMKFGDAQQLYSALGEAIAKGKGRLPGEVYHSLSGVRDVLLDSMRVAATLEGKFAQFVQAQMAWHKYMQTFFNIGAPLRSLMRIPEGATGKTMGQMMNTANRARITEALERYGIDTSDIKGLLSRGDKVLAKDLSDASRLKQLGPEVFQQQAKQEAVSSLKSKAIDAAWKVAIGTTVYELLKGQLKGVKP